MAFKKHISEKKLAICFEKRHFSIKLLRNYLEICITRLNFALRRLHRRKIQLLKHLYTMTFLNSFTCIRQNRK